MVTGWTTIPASNFLTLRTSSACSAIGMLRWITPTPPAWAIAIAKALSVTVSIAAEISGMPRLISRVNRVPVSVSAGRIPEAAGTSITSSKVNACRISIGRLLSDGGAIYTRAPRAIDIGVRRQLCAAAVPGRDNVSLGRFGAARRRLGMAQLREIPFQLCQQCSLGAALKHFGDKSSARFENLRRDGERVLGESDDAEMVRCRMAGRRR